MKQRFFLLMASLFLLAGCQTQPSSEKSITALNKSNFPQLSETIADNEAAVTLVTSKGDFTIKLFPEQAPLAVENFLTHAKNDYYDGQIFHRVINDFMIQGGDPLGSGRGGASIWEGRDASIDAGYGFRNEISNQLYHIRGSLGMANSGSNTNGSQFFINQNPVDQSAKLSPDHYPAKIIEAYTKGGNPTLDGGYTVFGQVIDGMSVVDDIAAVATDDLDKPLEEVIIKDILIIKDYTTD